MTDGDRLSRSLRLARPVLSPTLEQRERVRAALAARLAPGAAESAGTAARASAPRVAVTAGTQAAALGKAVLLLGVGFALGYWFAEARVSEPGLGARATPGVVSDPAAARFVAASPGVTAAARSTGYDAAAPSRTFAPAVAAPAEASTATERRERSIPSRRPHPATPHEVPAARLLAEELALLQRAERAIRTGEGALARGFIRELEERFPDTTLREERTAVLVLAACVLGEPGASSDARDFLAQHPVSVYFDRVRVSCDVPAAGQRPAASPDGSPARGHEWRGGKP